MEILMSVTLYETQKSKPYRNYEIDIIVNIHNA